MQIWQTYLRYGSHPSTKTVTGKPTHIQKEKHIVISTFQLVFGETISPEGSMFFFGEPIPKVIEDILPILGRRIT